MINRLWQLWKMRDTPYAHLAELHALVVMAARRCNYDLGHALQDIPLTHNKEYDDERGRHFFSDRHHMWEEVFNPADGGKHYRHRLHHKIIDLTHEVERLKELCAKHGIDDKDPTGPPF